MLDCCDYLTGQLLMPISSFLTCLFVGWYVPSKLVRDEFTNHGTVSAFFFRAFLFCVRFVCPVGIAIIFLHQLGVI